MTCTRCLHLIRLTGGSYSRLPGCSCGHYTHHNRVRSPRNTCLLTCIRCLLPPFVSPAADTAAASQAAHAATTLITTVCDVSHPQQPMPSVAMPLLCCAGHPCRCRCPRLIRLTATSACLLLADVTLLSPCAGQSIIRDDLPATPRLLLQPLHSTQPCASAPHHLAFRSARPGPLRYLHEGVRTATTMCIHCPSTPVLPSH